MPGKSNNGVCLVFQLLVVVKCLYFNTVFHRVYRDVRLLHFTALRVFLLVEDYCIYVAFHELA